MSSLARQFSLEFNELRIPMRGYEGFELGTRSHFLIVTHPHEGL